jgi:AcrR family transcriptional regulator
VSRPPKYSSEQILDAVLEVLKRTGPADLTVAMVSDVLGAPSGSIYHRFDSRDALVASAWLRTGERFAAQLTRALQGSDPLRGALLGVDLTLDWARRRPTEASFFLLHSRGDFTSGEWPASLARRATRLGNELTDALRTVASGLPAVSLARARFALFDVPQAAIRRALVSGSALDGEVQRLVEETVLALLAPAQPLTRMAS